MMDYNNRFRRYFDLDCIFNELTNHQEKLFSDFNELFDMTWFHQSPQPSSYFNNQDSYKILNKSFKKDDVIKRATPIPVVHLPSTSSSDNSISSLRSTGQSYSQKNKISSSKKSSDAETEVDELTDILMAKMSKNGTKDSHNANNVQSSQTLPSINKIETGVISNFSPQSKNSFTHQSKNNCFRCKKPFPATSDILNNPKMSARTIHGPFRSHFHQSCFNCYHCNSHLNTDSFFYAQKRLLCSKCVQDSLEKCTVCNILINERVIRILGQPYHPKCFICSICNCCLDGKAFTVDVHERMFCLDDFHRKYAPRCDGCGDVICPEKGDPENKRVISSDKVFHLECFGAHGRK